MLCPALFHLPMPGIPPIATLTPRKSPVCCHSGPARDIRDKVGPGAKADVQRGATVTGTKWHRERKRMYSVARWGPGQSGTGSECGCTAWRDRDRDKVGPGAKADVQRGATVTGTKWDRERKRMYSVARP